MEKGHWYTDKNGNHYFVENGQSPKEGWEQSKRRKMIDGGKYKVDDGDGKGPREVSREEWGKYEADDDFDATTDDDFGFDEDDGIVSDISTAMNDPKFVEEMTAELTDPDYIDDLVSDMKDAGIDYADPDEVYKFLTNDENSVTSHFADQIMDAMKKGGYISDPITDEDEEKAPKGKNVGSIPDKMETELPDDPQKEPHYIGPDGNRYDSELDYRQSQKDGSAEPKKEYTIYGEVLKGDERKRMEDLAKAFNDAGLEVTVEETYRDYGAGAEWTTLVNGDAQILTPKDWADYMNGEISAQELVDKMKNDRFLGNRFKQPAGKPTNSEYKPAYDSEDFGDARYYKNSSGSGREYYDIASAHGIANEEAYRKDFKNKFKLVGQTKDGADIYQGPDGYFSTNPLVTSMSFRTKEALQDYEDKRTTDYAYGGYNKDNPNIPAPEAYAAARRRAMRASDGSGKKVPIGPNGAPSKEWFEQTFEEELSDEDYMEIANAFRKVHNRKKGK